MRCFLLLCACHVRRWAPAHLPSAPNCQRKVPQPPARARSPAKDTNAVHRLCNAHRVNSPCCPAFGRCDAGKAGAVTDVAPYPPAEQACHSGDVAGRGQPLRLALRNRDFGPPACHEEHRHKTHNAWQKKAWRTIATPKRSCKPTLAASGHWGFRTHDNLDRTGQLRPASRLAVALAQSSKCHNPKQTTAVDRCCSLANSCTANRDAPVSAAPHTFQNESRGNVFLRAFVNGRTICHSPTHLWVGGQSCKLAQSAEAKAQRRENFTMSISVEVSACACSVSQQTVKAGSRKCFQTNIPNRSDQGLHNWLAGTRMTLALQKSCQPHLVQSHERIFILYQKLFILYQQL